MPNRDGTGPMGWQACEGRGHSGFPQGDCGNGAGYGHHGRHGCRCMAPDAQRDTLEARRAALKQALERVEQRLAQP